MITEYCPSEKLEDLVLWLRAQWVQRLIEVRNQVVNVFQADRHPQQVLRSLGVASFDRGAMFHLRVRSAEACGANEEMRSSRYAHGFRLAPFNLDRQHAAETALHLPFGELVVGMSFESWIVDRLHGRMQRELRADADP